MAEIGKINRMKVLRTVRIGMFLDGGQLGDILLPNALAPHGDLTGQEIDAFIFRDSEDRLVATTRMPKLQVGETGVLRVTDTNVQGAFVDWGLPKDLLVPFREQAVKMERGSSYLVHVYLDQLTQRIVGSSRLHRFLNLDNSVLEEGQEVDIVIGQGSELGHLALIGRDHVGMIYSNEIFRKITVGEECKGYIKKLRPDGKIDLALQPPMEEQADDLTSRVLEELRANKGFLMLNDKTPPVIIYKRFGVSKNVFKRAIATLYRERKITIEKIGIRLVPDGE